MFVTEITFSPKQNQEKYTLAMRSLPRLANQIRRIIMDGNRLGLSASTDAEDAAMTPLSPNTLNRGGGGPPLIPRNQNSRFIRNFKVRFEVLKTTLRFRCYWTRLPFLVFHEEGTSKMPRRNPSGIRANDLQRIEASINRHFGFSADFEVKTDVRS